MFLQHAIQADCERISLEVLADNHRAIRFYEKKNFTIHNKLLYYHVDETQLTTLLTICSSQRDRKEVSPTLAALFIKEQKIGHINWQNETDYFLCDPNVRCFQYQDESSEEIKGIIAISNSGHIYQLWVSEDSRRHGIGTALILHSYSRIRPEKISLSFPNEFENLDFLSSLGFIKDPVEQYEMFYTLI